MSDIFYSKVNQRVQEELNARGLSGWNRTTDDLNFMLAKTAGVEIIPYAKDSSKQFKPIPEGVLNGLTIRDGEFLPGGERGFLTDRKWERVGGENPGSGVNSSKRLPPYVTSVDVQIADHSIGLLNTCTFNILVQNPEQDLEYIETIYCRPGRPVDVTIAYPDSAVITGDLYLADEPMDSTKRIAALKQENAVNTDTTADAPRPKQKLNETRFQGLVINFSIDYQADLTCVVNVVVRGTSNVFTDVTAIMKSATSTVNDTNTTQQKFNTELNASTLYNALKQDFDKQIFVETERKYHENKNEEAGYPQGLAYPVKRVLNNKIYFGLTGRLYEKTGIVEQYISLGWLIEFINNEILTKLKGVLPVPKIFFDSSITKSGIFYDSDIVSTLPEEIVIPDYNINPASWKRDTQESIEGNDSSLVYRGEPTNEYISLTVLPQNEFRVSSEEPTGYLRVQVNLIDQNDEEYQRDVELLNTKRASDCENILINLKVIEQKFNQLTNKKTGNVLINEFLQAIFQRIKYATGNFIDFKLISHPDDPETLILYNINVKTSILNQKSTGTIRPYSVPMFSNHPYGSIVTDFKFSGQLPKDSANLAFAINDIDTDIADDTIAPFLNFMYSQNEITRRIDNNIVVDTYDTIISESDAADRYRVLQVQAQDRLLKAKNNFGKLPTSDAAKQELHAALVNFVKYIGKDLKDQYLVKSPVLPFTVEFTTNGINGLKWGDVLTFDALPSRYKRNLVFSIIAISHTVNETGEWSTNVKCVSRVKIDE